MNCLTARLFALWVVCVASLGTGSATDAEQETLIGTIVKWRYPEAEIRESTMSDAETVNAAGERTTPAVMKMTTMVTEDSVENVLAFYRERLKRNPKNDRELGLDADVGCSVQFRDESEGRPFALHTILVNTTRTSTTLIITRGENEEKTYITWKQYQTSDVEADMPDADAVETDARLTDRRFEGTEISVDGLKELEGKSWNEITLVDGPFNGEIAHALERAESIHRLRLGCEEIAGFVSWIKVVPGLCELELLDGSPLARDLQAIGEMAQLTRLKLPAEMTINVNGAKDLSRLVHLTSLDLYSVSMDDSSFQELAGLTQLEELDLSHTYISDAGLQTLRHFPALKRLRLHRHPEWSNPVQLTDDCTYTIASLKQLEELAISGEIGDVGLQRIGALPALKRLNVAFTSVTPDGLAGLEGSGVEHLTLSASLPERDVRDIETIAEHLRECPNLQSVTFHGGGGGGSLGFAKTDVDWDRLLPGVGIGMIDP